MVTFSDASKANDKIDPWHLFNKLLNIHLSVFIVSIIVYWYSRQEMFIIWGNTYSKKFVYMNNLSLSLNSSGIGDSLGDNIINHLCYADHLCLISLSSSGMQHLLDMCDTYANSHQLSYPTIAFHSETSY